MLAQVQTEEGRRGLGGRLHPGLVLAVERDRLAAVQEHLIGSGGARLPLAGAAQGAVQADRGRSHADRPDPGGAGQQQLPSVRPAAFTIADLVHWPSSSSPMSSSPSSSSWSSSWSWWSWSPSGPSPPSPSGPSPPSSSGSSPSSGSYSSLAPAKSLTVAVIGCSVPSSNCRTSSTSSPGCTAVVSDISMM